MNLKIVMGAFVLTASSQLLGAEMWTAPQSLTDTFNTVRQANADELVNIFEEQVLADQPDIHVLTALKEKIAGYSSDLDPRLIDIEELREAVINGDKTVQYDGKTYRILDFTDYDPVYMPIEIPLKTLFSQCDNVHANDPADTTFILSGNYPNGTITSSRFVLKQTETGQPVKNARKF